MCLFSFVRFGYRGFMLDLARHFHNKASVLRQLDLMARYRLNKLHLHLADDESWSIEIEEIPELTQVLYFIYPFINIASMEMKFKAV